MSSYPVWALSLDHRARDDTRRFPPGTRLREQAQSSSGEMLHSHAQGQVYFVTSGFLIIEHAGGRWSMPPRQVGWVPPNVPHAGLEISTVGGWAAYLDPSLCAGLPTRPCVLEYSPLVPLILERLSALLHQPPEPVQGLPPRADHLVQVLLDELHAARPTGRHLPFPGPGGLTPVVRALLKNPADPRGVDQWARLAGMSQSTLGRAFRRETGMSFTQWRRWARLLRSQELLAAGAAVQQAAWTVGYENVSAFIAGFKKAFGQTPAQFVRSQGG